MKMTEKGSGKTASFLLPTLERLCQSGSVRSRRRDAAGRLILGPVGTKAVVLIPTRELAVRSAQPFFFEKKKGLLNFVQVEE